MGGGRWGVGGGEGVGGGGPERLLRGLRRGKQISVACDGGAPGAEPHGARVPRAGWLSGKFEIRNSKSEIVLLRDHLERHRRPQDPHRQQTPALTRRLADFWGHRRFEGGVLVTLGEIAVHGARRAHPIRTETGGEVGEAAGELVGVDLGGAEKRELAAARPVGVGDGDEGDHGSPRRFRLQFEVNQCQQGVDVAGGGGQADRAVFGALRFEPQFELEQGAGKVLALEALAGPLQRLAKGVEQGLDGDHRPLQLHALVEGRRWVVGLERARVHPAGRAVGAGAGRTEPAGGAIGRQPGKVAEGADAPPAQGVHEPPVEGQVGQGQGSEEKGFLTGRHHLRRVGHVGGDAGGQLVAGDAHPDREIEGGGGDDGGLPHVVLVRGAVVETLHPADVGKDDVRGGVLDPWREAGGGLEEGLVGRALGGGVAAAGDQRGQDPARLGEAHARTHARSAGRSGGPHHPRGGPVALAHRHRLARQLRLRAQPRRQRKEGDEQAGDSRHEVGIRIRNWRVFSELLRGTIGRNHRDAQSGDTEPGVVATTQDNAKTQRRRNLRWRGCPEWSGGNAGD